MHYCMRLKLKDSFCGKLYEVRDDIRQAGSRLHRRRVCD